MTQTDHSQWKGHPGCDGCPFAEGEEMHAQGMIWMDEITVTLCEVVWLPKIWRGCPAWPHLLPEPHILRYDGWEQQGEVCRDASFVREGSAFDYGMVEYRGVGRPTRKTE